MSDKPPREVNLCWRSHAAAQQLCKEGNDAHYVHTARPACNQLGMHNPTATSPVMAADCNIGFQTHRDRQTGRLVEDSEPSPGYLRLESDAICWHHSVMPVVV
jgi:hypothetical protein